MRGTTDESRRRLKELYDKAIGRIRENRAAGVSRRDFLHLSAAAGAAASVGSVGTAVAAQKSAHDQRSSSAPDEFNEATIAQLQQGMATGRVSSVELTRFYLRRIRALDEGGARLNSVLELNPDAMAIAQQADARRRGGQVLGPLHGIPVMLKDNIDTGDRMQTTAGSFGLAGQPADADSTVAAKLRAGGAVLLGKLNLSEWANFRSFFSSSGWSGRGGQCNNPYAIDRNPCGSSSGSGAAVSANLCAVSLGSETDGSIVCPSSLCGVVGIKPTVGLTSRAGVVPISHIQDTIGPHARTVADAAATLGVIQSLTFDGRDPATGGVPLGRRGLSTRPTLPTDYTQFLNPDGLRGRRIGVTGQGVEGASPDVAAIFDQAKATMAAAGAILTDLDAEGFEFPPGDGEFLVLLFDFVGDLQAYFATRSGVPLAGGTLADAIAFNEANADREMPFFGQEIFELAAALEPGEDTPQPIFGGLTYNQALEIDRLATVNGIDAALADFNVEAIVTPTGTPAWCTDLIDGDHFIFATSSLAAIGGYPIVNVPMGNYFGLPVGLSFIGTAFSEPILIRLASGFENVARARIVPRFFPTLPLRNVKGIPLRRLRGRGKRRHHSM
ncbi:MAG TPA: amidase [Vicinamibacterales bacterium]|jgi:amidase|nr:amidase [Vicinamibacterales bacterium]